MSEEAASPLAPRLSAAGASAIVAVGFTSPARSVWRMSALHTLECTSWFTEGAADGTAPSSVSTPSRLVEVLVGGGMGPRGRARCRVARVQGKLAFVTR